MGMLVDRKNKKTVRPIIQLSIDENYKTLNIAIEAGGSYCRLFQRHRWIQKRIHGRLAENLRNRHRHWPLAFSIRRWNLSIAVGRGVWVFCCSVDLMAVQLGCVPRSVRSEFDRYVHAISLQISAGQSFLYLENKLDLPNALNSIPHTLKSSLTLWGDALRTIFVAAHPDCVGNQSMW